MPRKPKIPIKNFKTAYQKLILKGFSKTQISNNLTKRYKIGERTFFNYQTQIITGIKGHEFWTQPRNRKYKKFKKLNQPERIEKNEIKLEKAKEKLTTAHYTYKVNRQIKKIHKRTKKKLTITEYEKLKKAVKRKPKLIKDKLKPIPNITPIKEIKPEFIEFENKKRITSREEYYQINDKDFYNKIVDDELKEQKRLLSIKDEDELRKKLIENYKNKEFDFSFTIDYYGNNPLPPYTTIENRDNIFLRCKLSEVDEKLNELNEKYFNILQINECLTDANIKIDVSYEFIIIKEYDWSSSRRSF